MIHSSQKKDGSSILQKWIAPLTTDDFFSQFWEKKPLVLTDRKSNCFTNILTLKDVDFLLSSLNSSVGFYKPIKWVRFVNNKKELKLDDYLQNESDFLNMDKVLAGFASGNTIVLNRLQHRWESVWKICHELEEALGHFVSANMYLSPENAQGFDAHYDPHDVFILQLEGEKLWKIYPERIAFPTGFGDTPFIQPLSPPIHELHLKSGDLLYIPRGWVHAASTAKKHSLHLTVGVHVLTWLDLIAEIATTDISLRQAIPKEFILQEQKTEQGLSGRLQALTNLFENEQIVKESIQKLQKKFTDKRTPSLSGYLTTFSDAGHVSEKTLIHRKGEKWQIEKMDDKLAIHFNGVKVRVPVVTESLMEYMSNTREFFVYELPGPIPLKDKIEIVRTLMKSGLLTVAPFH
ncbi:MAG TPA: cupin domain-containing protein [Rhabdochlamydiaceae bacterium]|nr:cupin domain-containing protein [Rhabdochlamydiaceae bacterium]